MAVEDEKIWENFWKSLYSSLSIVGDQVMKGSKTAKHLDSSYNANTSLASHNETKSKGHFRKRKERSHSIGGKDKKVIRSNSEERIIKKNVCNKGIRRVSSHEDFQKVPSIEDNLEDLKENAVTSEIQENVNYSNNDEVEWKRSGERLFRLPLYRRKHNYLRRSPKLRPLVTTQYEETTISLNNNEEEECITLTKFSFGKAESLQPPTNQNEKKEGSSPYSSPSSSVLDLTTLHKQIDCIEPIPSNTSRYVSDCTETLPSASVACNKLLSSPRNSLISTERIYLSQYVAQTKSSPLKSLNPVEKRLNSLSKQIKRVKKKIRQYEHDFEQRRGFKPSEMDKLNDPYANTLLIDLYKLKKDYKLTKKQEKVVLPTSAESSDDCESLPNSSPATLTETLTEIEQRLSSKRNLSERTDLIEEMTNDQLLEEKVDIQKVLLYLQTKHGRPNTKEDKDLVRPLYDRYRVVKRLISRSSLPSSTVPELATIHEHETLHIVPSSETPPSTPLTDSLQDSTKELEKERKKDDDTASVEKKLHALSLHDLIEEKRCTVEEKKRLQKLLKDFENNFCIKVGRKIQKDDREPMNHVYDAYKKAKAKLKLLDALVKKASSPFPYSR